MPSHSLTRTTPFPNFLLDEVMPTLKDTEWRLLCVIVRQTLGWQDKAGGRKKRDWLTRAQLKTRTGRDSEALSKGLDALVKWRLVDVRNEQGQPLSTTRERRMARGRIYYALHPLLLEKTKRIVSETELEQVRQEKGEPAPIVPQPVVPQVVPQIARSERKSGLVAAAKANGTKETLTKESVTKETVTKIFAMENPQTTDATQTSGEASASLGTPASLGLPAPSATQEPLPHELEPEAARFIHLYEQKYRNHSGNCGNSGISSPRIWWSRDVKRVNELLARFSLENLTDLLEVFFAADIGCIRRQGHSLQAFTGSIHILRLIAKADRPIPKHGGKALRPLMPEPNSRRL